MKRLLVELKDEQALRTYTGITVRGNESRRSAAR
jgi:hypothetical protein